MTSIFQRLFLTYLAITILLVVIIAGLLSHFIYDAQLRQKQRELTLLGTEVNELVNLRPYARNHDTMQILINKLGLASGNKIYLLKTKMN